MFYCSIGRSNTIHHVNDSTTFTTYIMSHAVRNTCIIFQLHNRYAVWWKFTATCMFIRNYKWKANLFDMYICRLLCSCVKEHTKIRMLISNCSNDWLDWASQNENVVTQSCILNVLKLTAYNVYVSAHL